MQCDRCCHQEQPARTKPPQWPGSVADQIKVRTSIPFRMTGTLVGPRSFGQLGGWPGPVLCVVQRSQPDVTTFTRWTGSLTAGGITDQKLKMEITSPFSANLGKRPSCLNRHGSKLKRRGCPHRPRSLSVLCHACFPCFQQCRISPPLASATSRLHLANESYKQAN